MISHNEAQALLSARQDQMLDPIAEHELNAHLATCDSCRAFARATESLTQGLRTLPYMPASPAVRRAVLDCVEQGRSPFARLGGMFQASPGPALSTLAIIALVVVLGFFAFNRFVLQEQDGGDEGRQLASQPTEQAPVTETPQESLTLQATETPEPTVAPTETIAATEAPTETPAPTEEPTEEAATEQPTQAPTEEPAPTKEPTAEPTATAEPTVEPTQAPTETPEGVGGTSEGEDGVGAASEPTEDVADLTIASDAETPEPTATTAPTPEPTATTPPTPEPTATAEPTPEPTDEPTVAPSPTATAEPTPEPTGEATSEPTTPAIVPIDGSQPVEAPEESGQPEDVSGRAPGDEAGSDSTKTSRPVPTIGPIDGETVTETETPDGQIELIGPTEAPAAAETPEATGPATEESIEAEEAEDLASASEGYQDIAGEPGGRLVLTNDGRMVFGDQPHEPTMVTPAGRTLETVETETGQAVALCDAGGVCTNVSSGSRAGAATDTPLGIIGADVIYARQTGDTIEYRRSAVEGSTVISDELLYSGTSSDAPQGTVYDEGDRLWIPTSGGDWVMLSDTGGTLLAGGYANPQLVRFAATDQGMLVGFVAEGQLVIAPAESPSSPLLVLPFSGEDFDMAPSGDRVAVSTGSSIDVYDMSGTLLVSYSSPDIRPGTVLWLNGGIVYVNDETGALYQIPETAS